MTDIMKLLERLRDPREQDEGLCIDAADAIEALQAENERLKVASKTWQHEAFVAKEREKNLIAERDKLQAENERLKEQHLDLLSDVLDAKEAMLKAGVIQDSFTDMFSAYASLRDALQAKLDELQRQEPVIDFTVLHQFANDQAISYNKLCTAVRMCLAAPKALEPLTDEQIAVAFGWAAGHLPLVSEIRATRAIEAAHGITKGTPT